MNPKVDFFFGKEGRWQAEFRLLRSIILECGLAEELKWGVPCYTFQKRNIVLMHGFKEYCALLFFKGVLLKDEAGLLIRQTENVQAARQVRFTEAGAIAALKPTLKAYIYEAIEVEKAGRKVQLRATADYPVPEEFRRRLEEEPVLKKAFEGLTPGRQRAYLFYFSQPKTARTREERIAKSIPGILEGKGPDD